MNIKQLLLFPLIILIFLASGCRDKPSTPTQWTYTSSDQYAFLNVDKDDGSVQFIRGKVDSANGRLQNPTGLVTLNDSGDIVTEAASPFPENSFSFFTENIIFSFAEDENDLRVTGYDRNLQRLFSTAINKHPDHSAYIDSSFIVNQHGVIVHESLASSNRSQLTFLSSAGKVVQQRFVGNGNREFNWLANDANKAIIAESFYDENSNSQNVTHVIDAGDRSFETVNVDAKQFLSGYLITTKKLESGIEIRYHATNGDLVQRQELPLDTPVNFRDVTLQVANNTLYTVIDYALDSRGEITVYQHASDGSVVWEKSKSHEGLTRKPRFEDVKITEDENGGIILTYDIEGGGRTVTPSANRITILHQLHHLKLTESGEEGSLFVEEYYHYAYNTESSLPGSFPLLDSIPPPVIIDGIEENFNVVPLPDNGLLTVGKFGPAVGKAAKNAGIRISRY